MTVKGTLKYRKVERTPQVGIELLDNRVTVEDGTADGGDNGGSTPTALTNPSGGSDAGSKGDNTGLGGGSSSSGTEEPGNEFD